MSKRSFKRTLDLAVIAVAIALLVPLVKLWAVRMTHPFDLEWMEGGMLAHAWRLAKGLPIYDASAVDFIPYLYPPGYAALLAALSKLFPLGYALARSVSLLGSFAAAGAIAWFCHRLLRDTAAGIIGALLFVLCYGGSGGYYDVARVDGLAMGLLAWAVVLGADKRRGRIETAAILLSALFFVKQSLVVVALPMALGIWARDGFRKSLRFVLVASLPTSVVTLWLQSVTHGEFWTYVFDVPRYHPFQYFYAFPGSFGEIALLLGPAWLACIAWVTVRASRTSPFTGYVFLLAPLLAAFAATFAIPYLSWPVGVGLFDDSIRQATLVLVGLSIGSVSLAWTNSSVHRSWMWMYGTGVGLCILFVTAMMRGHHGGFVNVLIPSFWLVCFAMTIVCARVRSGMPRKGAHVASAFLFILQLFWVSERNDSRAFAPTPQDVAAGQIIVEKIRDCRGPVFSPVAPWLAVQAGFEPSSHAIAIWDIDHPGSPHQPLVEQLRNAAHGHHWGCVITSQRLPAISGIDEGYPVVVPLPISKETFWPRGGWQGRPDSIRFAPSK